MDDVPLPKVDYDAGWHRQYTADQMHAHAAAVSAAKDAEIAQLRADLIKSLADNKALREFVEHVRRNGSTHLASMAIAVLAARKGTTPTTPPPSPSPRS